jgi:hypothetical protein
MEVAVGLPANTYRRVWERTFVNEIAPMDVLIADDGRYVVTIDDYGRTGLGDNAVVIYDAEGKLMNRYKLSDFLSQEEIDGPEIPRSASSIFWAGQHRFDAKKGVLLLQVWQSGGNPDADGKTKAVKYRTVSIRLGTGEILKGK